MSRKNSKNNSRKIVIAILCFVLIVTGLTALGTFSKSPSAAQAVPASSFKYDTQPFIGNADAPVSIVEFGDFKCPACQAWENTIYPQVYADLIETGKAKMYFINFPFIGQDSFAAAEIGEAVAAQGNEAFFKYYDIVYKSQQDESLIWATPDFLYSLIEQHIPEVDLDKVKKDIEDQTYVSAVDSDLDIVKNIGVNATPSIFVNGIKADNGKGYAGIADLVNQATTTK